jgi:hypothetical protein
MDSRVSLAPDLATLSGSGRIRELFTPPLHSLIKSAVRQSPNSEFGDLWQNLLHRRYTGTSLQTAQEAGRGPGQGAPREIQGRLSIYRDNVFLPGNERTTADLVGKIFKGVFLVPTPLTDGIAL